MLVGQPELNDMLERPELRQLRQRIVLRHPPWSGSTAEDLDHYVDERLRLAGYTGRGIFKPLGSQGAVRGDRRGPAADQRSVRLCAAAGYSRQQQVIGDDIIREAAAELHLVRGSRAAQRADSGTAPSRRAAPTASPRGSCARCRSVVPIRSKDEGMAKVYDALRRAEEERRKLSEPAAQDDRAPRWEPEDAPSPSRPAIARRVAVPPLWPAPRRRGTAADFNKRRIALLQPDPTWPSSSARCAGGIDAHGDAAAADCARSR
jgi:general secretion pathway protein A